MLAGPALEITLGKQVSRGLHGFLFNVLRRLNLDRLRRILKEFALSDVKIVLRHLSISPGPHGRTNPATATFQQIDSRAATPPVSGATAGRTSPSPASAPLEQRALGSVHAVHEKRIRRGRQDGQRRSRHHALNNIWAPNQAETTLAISVAPAGLVRPELTRTWNA